MYFLVYAIFMCKLQKIFFLRDMMDNQCANIFSTYATVYGSYSAMFAFYWKREYFFFMCILHLFFFFKLGLCLFIYPTPFIFSQNFFCFSYFYRGRNFFLTFVVLRGSCCSSQGELSLFSLTLLHMFSVYLLIRQSLSIRDKKGERFR